jgi:hypothetical protein
MELMQASPTEKRLDDLNHKVDQGFERVETEIRSLRAESRGEFSSLREGIKGLATGLPEEIRGAETGLRSEIKEESLALRAEMKAGFDAMDGRFERMHLLLLQFCGGLFASFVVAAAALIATQL